MKTLLTIVIAIAALLVSSTVSAAPPAPEVCLDIQCKGETCAFVEIECPIVDPIDEAVRDFENALSDAEYEYQRTLSEWNLFWETEGR